MTVGAHRTANATVAAHSAAAVVLNDSTELQVTRALYVGTGGDIKVTMAYGDVVTFKNTMTGLVLPIQVIKVWSTGTTASNIIALY